MSFSTLEFILIFLPAFLAIYYLALLITKRSMIVANILVLAGSLAFCGYADYKAGTFTNILILVIQIVVNYLLIFSIDYYNNKPARSPFRKMLFVFLVLLDVFVLLFYKIVIGRLPLGLSFYTFTMIAYAADVFARKESADNFLNTAVYFSMFPKLVQGPITRYSDFAQLLKKREITLAKFDRSLKLFIYGLSLKVIIADRVGCLFNDIQMIGFESVSTPLAWMGVLSYSMELYFDFSGYTMMAIGLGSMLGFHFPKNFANPYASKTVSEFYRRWHITLGEWFRDYIYIPLGGSRKGMPKTIFNLLVVWVVTGLWHGITWNFIIWGLYLFFFIALEKLFLAKWLNKSKIISHLYLWVVILVSWAVFAINNLKKLGIYMTRLFPFIQGNYQSNINPDDYIKYGKTYGGLLAVCLLLCIPKVHDFLLITRRKWWSTLVAAVLFVMCLYYLSKGLANPFMYFVF